MPRRRVDRYDQVVGMENIEIAVEAGVANVALNRPERRNALSVALLRELHEVLADCGTDRSVRAITISGNGPVFSAGHDLTEMIDRDSSFYEELFRECTEVMDLIHAVPQPVIAVVHGMATAAGCQLVAASDLAIASDDCWFATPGVKIGLFCSTPMVPIVRSVGRKRALHMLFTGEPIDAATAVDWGLINSAVPAAELSRAAASLVSQIVRYSPDVIASGKRTFYRQLGRSEEDAYGVALPVMAANAAHADAQEGIRAFLEKRQPDWPSQT